MPCQHELLLATPLACPLVVRLVTPRARRIPNCQIREVTVHNMSPSLAAVLLGLLSVHATEEHARNVAQLEPKLAMMELAHTEVRLLRR